MNEERRSEIIKEFEIRAVKSAGPGGQHVNKVSTKIELRFQIDSSLQLTEIEKVLIKLQLANRINNEGELVLSDQSSRSQFKNKQAAINKFFELLEFALKPRKKRIATKPTKASKKKRIDDKKRQSLKKELRKKWDE